MGFERISAEEWSVCPVSLLSRQKMLLTAEDDAGRMNSMTVGWGGFGVMWGKPTVCYAIRPSRYTFGLAEAGRRISLSAFDPCDAGILSYFGSHSGRDGDKYAAASLSPIRMEDGGVGFLRANLVITAEKAYSAPLREDGFSDGAYSAQWYPRGDLHVLYFATVCGIYLRKN